jgi:hypothetical protein
MEDITQKKAHWYFGKKKVYMSDMRKEELLTALKHSVKKLNQENNQREECFTKIAQLNNELSLIQEKIELTDRKMLQWDSLGEQLKNELSERFSVKVDDSIEEEKLYEMIKASNV